MGGFEKLGKGERYTREKERERETTKEELSS